MRWKGASVVVDAGNTPSWEDAAVLHFFETSTRNLLDYGAAAGVRHHVALSVVGTERLLESGFFRAKLAQENLIKASAIPYSIVRATQFFEFAKSIADVSTEGNKVRLPPVFFQPMAADDVSSALSGITTSVPVNGTVEIGGPEQFRLDEFICWTWLRARIHEVISDQQAHYYGIAVSERSLVPNDDARLRRNALRRLAQSRHETNSTDIYGRHRCSEGEQLEDFTTDASTDHFSLPASGKRGLMITAGVSTGASIRAHRHDAHAFLYVVEGSVVMQLLYEGPRTFILV